MITMDMLKKCNLCNRHCLVDRTSGQTGYCGQTDQIMAARAALHYWEEPCISGTRGSGAVFFSGCSLRCVFCQNHDIALGTKGKPLSTEQLAETFLALQEKGAHNINLVTGTHFIPQIVQALTLAQNQGLSIPIVYNTGSYETKEALQMLEGLVDIYLPDLKYFDPAVSMRYAHTSDYFSHASSAIAEMFRQVGAPSFMIPSSGASSLSGNHAIEETSGLLEKSAADATDMTYLSENAILSKGVIVRHLLLPGQAADSKKILSYLARTYGDSIFISLMNQYTPMLQFLDIHAYPELSRRVSEKEYDSLVDYALSLGLENVFIQDGEAADESFIPPFDFEGLLS